MVPIDPNNQSQPSASTEAAVESCKEPYAKPLAASAIIFAAFIALARTAVAHHWLLEARNVSFAVFAAAIFGLTTIVVFSAVAWPFRMLAGSIPLIGKHLYEWKEPEPEGLLACAMCSGMWLGAILAALGVTIFPINSTMDLVTHGLIGSGIAWFLYAVTNKLGAYH